MTHWFLFREGDWSGNRASKGARRTLSWFQDSTTVPYRVSSPSWKTKDEQAEPKLLLRFVLSTRRKASVKTPTVSSFGLAPSCGSCWLGSQFTGTGLVNPVPTFSTYLVDPASSHMLVPKTKPCMSKYKHLYCETADGSLKQSQSIRWSTYSDNRSNSTANTCRNHVS